jgi:hypothetical protein
VTRHTLWQTILPVASFLALNIHLDPTMLVPVGGSTSSQAPAIANVVSSSRIPPSYKDQLGRHLASARLTGLSASALAVNSVSTKESLATLLSSSRMVIKCLVVSSPTRFVCSLAMASDVGS